MWDPKRRWTGSRAAARGAIAGLAVLCLTVAPGPACVRGDEGTKRAPPPAAGDRPDAAERAELAREVDQLEAFSRVFRRVAALARPSVVSIHVKGLARSQPLLPGDDFLRRFFGDLPAQAPRPVEISSGTGVIIDADGSILTNNHVVGPDGATITVTLHDGRTFEARVHGRDPKTDLALLRLESPPDDLVPAVLGDSDALEVGDWVVAVGSPFGLQQSVTAGIVSAKGRANVGITDLEDFIQTDAALNPGNSGGPLLNLRGEVVGINTAIASRTGTFQGVGFAIPIAMARHVAEQLGQTGRVVRGWLGVAIRDLTPDDRRALGLEQRPGVMVAEVTEGGPAEAAGLRAGDVILAVGGEPARDVQRLRNLVARSGAGEDVAVLVWRDGEERTLQVRLGRQPDDEATAALRGQPRAPERPAPRARSPRDDAPPASLGLRARELTPELAARYGHPHDARGVIVTGVEPAGVAARAGVEPGWIIRSFDGRPIETLDDLDAAVEAMDLRRGVQLALEGPRGMRQTVFMRSN